MVQFDPDPVTGPHGREGRRDLVVECPVERGVLGDDANAPRHD
jgi:hypothetical protein